jgi:hypothetical protein
VYVGLTPAVTALQVKLLAVPPSLSVEAVPNVVSVTVTTAPDTVDVTPIPYVAPQEVSAAFRFVASVAGVVLTAKVPAVALLQPLLPVLFAGTVAVGLSVRAVVSLVLQATVLLVELVTVTTAPLTVAETLAFFAERL